MEIEIAEAGGDPQILVFVLSLNPGDGGPACAAEIGVSKHPEKLLASVISKLLEENPKRVAQITVSKVEEVLAVDAVARASGIPVLLTDQPDIVSHFLDAFRESFLGGVAGTLRFTAIEGATPELLKDFFNAACKLWIAAPWKVILDSEVVTIKLPTRGPILCSIIGNLDVEYGISLFLDPAAYHELLEQNENEEFVPPRSSLALLYLHQDFIGDENIEDAERHSWDVSSADAWPHPVKQDDRGKPAEVTAEDLRTLVLCVKALLAFLDRMEVWPPEFGATVISRFGKGKGMTEVEVVYLGGEGEDGED